MKKTRIRNIVYYTLMFLPFLITMIALPYLPDQIPAHYGMDHQVTRWGSKYETLIFPVITIAFGLIMLAIAKYVSKKEEYGKNNEKACIITGILSMILFNAMTGYFLYTDFNTVENLSEVPVDINRLCFALLGILMIVVGNIMPKLRMNSMIGLRTGWSMKNETTWKKSQFAGGIIFLIGGILITVICLFAEGIRYLLWSMVILLVSAAAAVIASYKIAKKCER